MHSMQEMDFDEDDNNSIPMPCIADDTIPPLPSCPHLTIVSLLICNISQTFAFSKLQAEQPIGIRRVRNQESRGRQTDRKCQEEGQGPVTLCFQYPHS